MNTHCNTPAAARVPADVLDRMTALMRDRGEDAAVTEAELRQHFSEQDISKHASVAAAMASKRLVRNLDISEAEADELARLAIERQPRHTPEHGASIVTGLMPQMAMVTTRLREHGWTWSEITRHLPEICALAGRELAVMGTRYFNDSLSKPQ